MPSVSFIINMRPLRQGTAEAKKLFQNLTGEVQKTWKTVGSVKSYAGGIKAALMGSGIVLFAKQCFNAALQVDKLNKAFTTIKGNSKSAQEQLDHIRSVTGKVGLQFHETAESAKTFFAAGQGTTLEKDLDSIFEGVASAGSALALTQDEINGVFLALGQMISKGKVQAEELRGQMGERLPGAFQLAAKAMGMTTAELDKFMADGKLTAEDLLPKLGAALQKEFGEKAVAAGRGAQASVNRLNTAWTDLKANIGDSEQIVLAIDNVTSALKTLSQYADLRSVMQTFQQGMELAQKGLLDLDRFTKASFMERQKMVDALLNPRNSYSSILSWQEPEELRKKKSVSTTNKGTDRAKAAQQALESIYREIERLNGTGGEFGYELNSKLMQISKAAKDAGLSLEQMRSIQDAYSAAATDAHFQKMADAMRDVDIEIARMSGDYKTLQRLETERDIESLSKRLLSLGVAQAEVNAKMEEYKTLLEKTATGDKYLQEKLDFIKELEEKTGQYNLSQEYQNELIEQQVALWRTIPGLTEQQIAKMATLKRLEADTSGWAGVRRATMSYYADSMNLGEQFQGFMQDSISSFEDAFVSFTQTGKFSFSDMTNSIVSDLVRIAARAMVVAPLVQAITGGGSGGGGLMSWLGGAIGWATGSPDFSSGYTWNKMVSVSAGAIRNAKGNVFSGGNISDYSGSIVTKPTTFSYGHHLSAFASGGGLMGEAGPEAILPLDRARNGRLGLAMSGMDDIMQQAQRGFAAESAKYMKFIAEQRQTVKPQVTVNIINQTGQPMQAQTTATPNAQGGLDIETVLTQIESGIVRRDAAGRSQLTNHIDRTRGLSRAGRLYR